MMPMQGGQARTQQDTAASQTGGRSAKKKGSIFLNDSIKEVYGPKTTLWTTGYELFINKARYRPIDTSIVNYHRWTYPEQSLKTVQDLGNVGTALYSLYQPVRKFSGAVSGFDSYDPYYFSAEPAYFDTKSPYTRIQLVWGGNGRSMTRVEFKRAISPRWNIGFNYRPILVDKQIDKRRKGDRHVSSQYYDLHSSYRSKDDRYLAYGFYRRTKHRVFENGGVFLPAGSDFSSFFATNAAPVLYKVENNDLKREFQFNHSYKLASALEIYQSISLQKQENNFTDDYSGANNQIPYDNWIAVKKDTLKANDQMNFAVIQQEAGFKGRKGFLFYNAFYKFRNYKTTYRYLDPDTIGKGAKGTEHFIGGRLVFDIDSLTRLAGKFEINQRGNYSLEATLDGKWVEGSFVQSISAPGQFYQRYRGVHDFWSNDFRNITGLQAEALLKVPTRRFMLAPGLGYTLISNNVYMRTVTPTLENPQQVLPFQSTGIQSMLLPQLKMSLTFLKKMNLGLHARRALITRNDDKAFQVPDWLVNGQLAFKGFLFNKNLEAQIGFDVSWRSAWNAPGYDPVTQHYVVQDQTSVKPWLSADFFINGRIKRGRFFYKVHNLMQAAGGSGYLIIPGYPGQRTIMDFGFELVLFD
ncbi:MAG: putative porin [Bacteroidota bacterium]